MLKQSHPALKAKCRGPKSLSTKVDEEMYSFLERQAERAGVSKCEVLRRLLDFYRANTVQINSEAEL
jgi:negative regulator of replication initiation